jgi:hypothetical protein
MLMAKQPGSPWISGTDFHFIDDAGVEFYYTGTLQGAAPANALIGSAWIDGNNLFYIDQSRNIRYISPTTINSLGISAIAGSFFVNLYPRWITSGGQLAFTHGDHSNTTAGYWTGGYSDHSDRPSIEYSQSNHTDIFGSGSGTFNDHMNITASPAYSDSVSFGYSSGHTDLSYNTYPFHTDQPHIDFTASHYRSYPHSDAGNSTPSTWVPGYSDHSDFPTRIGP